MVLQSLRSYLVALVVAVALPLLVFSLMQVRDSARRHRAAIEEGLLNTSRAWAVAVERQLQANVASLTALGASTHLDSGDLSTFYKEAMRARTHQPWSSIWLCDPTGRQLLSLMRPYGAELPTLADRSYFKEVVRSERPAISDLFAGRLTAGHYIAVAVPIVRDGKLKYVLAAGFRPETLSSRVAPQGGESAARVVSIVDGDGTFVTRSRDPEKWIGRRAPETYIRAIGNKSEGIISGATTLEGETVHVAFNRLSGSGWFIDLRVPSAEVERELQLVLWQTAILGLVLLLMAMGAAVVLGRRIAQPIMALAAVAGDIAGGKAVELRKAPRVKELRALAEALRNTAGATLERDRLASELRLIFDNLREGLVTSTPDGKSVHWNAAALQMHGFATAMEAGVAIRDPQRLFAIATLDGETVPFEQWPLQRILHGETVRDLELVVRRLDKGWERIYDYADGADGAAGDGKGKPRLALVSISDITERKRAELALRRSEERFRLLVEQTVDGIFLTDAQGRFLDANSAGCGMLGYALDELVGMGFVDVVAPQDAPRIAQDLARLEGGVIVHSEWCFRRKDGSQFYGESALRQLPDGRLQSILRDISERRQVEAALRERRAQMQELQQLQVASLTAAAIAHELGQPLNAVASYTEAALQLLQAGNTKPDRLEYALQSATEQAQRAGRVVRELLHFLGTREHSLEAFDLNAAIRRALAITRSATVSEFGTHLELAPGLKPVFANILQVEKVLVNLLSNAVEATRSGGVALPAVTITIRTAAESHMVHVLVRDSGPGLDEATARRVFEPFYTTKRQGIGMGLAISRALIEAHGGKLWFELDAGPGAAFHFTLPFAK